MTDEYVDKIRLSLMNMPLSNPPLPWELVANHSVGGLTEIGYGGNSDDLLVVSSQGRGVFNCLSGERTSRDQNEFWEELDQVKLKSPGIGSLALQTIRLAGLHGGGLPRFTSDGWELEVIAVEWPNHFLFLSHTTMTKAGVRTEQYKINKDGPCEFRAFGFSDTEKTFAFATSCELSIYRRKPE